jgi:hypothetical protein
MSGSYRSVVLEAVGVDSYAELAALDTAEVIRRMDERRAPLHPGDAFLAVLVLCGLAERGEATERLDRASKRYEIAGVILAVVAVGVAIAQLASG